MSKLFGSSIEVFKTRCLRFALCRVLFGKLFQWQFLLQKATIETDFIVIPENIFCLLKLQFKTMSQQRKLLFKIGNIGCAVSRTKLITLLCCMENRITTDILVIIRCRTSNFCTKINQITVSSLQPTAIKPARTTHFVQKIQSSGQNELA